MNQKAYLKQINAMLQGRRIVKVEYMSKKDTEANYWDSSPIVISVENAGGDYIELIPMRDDEGNDGGAIATNTNLGTIGVW
tara:strand:- start:151 stop:393 length:243 start_codon:yes stop_codon:yes gene_type:complete